MDVKALIPVDGVSKSQPVDQGNRVARTRFKESKESLADAVFVKLGSEKVAAESPSIDEKAKVSEEGVQENQEALDKERAHLNEVAAKFEKELNQVAVKFDVSVVEPGEHHNDLRFQVVEKETGEVLREFPPDRVKAYLMDSDEESGLAGLFFSDEV